MPGNTARWHRGWFFGLSHCPNTRLRHWLGMGWLGVERYVGEATGTVSSSNSGYLRRPERHPVSHYSVLAASQNTTLYFSCMAETKAGCELLQLTRDLWQVKTLPQAEYWEQRLRVWHQYYGSFIRERTYKSATEPGRRRWWYTHRNLRSAYKQLDKLLRDDQLFTHLETLTDVPIPRTTNYVEGGINSQLRTKLKLHRGMSEEHQRRLVEWYLYSRTEGAKPPRKFL
jgi:hypothetical protein